MDYQTCRRAAKGLSWERNQRVHPRMSQPSRKYGGLPEIGEALWDFACRKNEDQSHSRRSPELLERSPLTSSHGYEAGTIRLNEVWVTFEEIDLLFFGDHHQ